MPGAGFCRTYSMGDVIEFPQTPFPELSDLDKERMRVQLLTSYLDKIDPDWRQKIKDMEKQ